MDSIEKIIWTLILLITLILYSKLIEKVISRLKIDDDSVVFNYNVLSRKDLGNLHPSDFTAWCSEYLKCKGYSNVQFKNNDSSLICSLGKDTVHVKCLHYNFPENASDEDCPKVLPSDVQEFLGYLAYNKAAKGMIITNGCISEEASQLANSMPEPYQIKFIDGLELVDDCRRLYDNGLVISSN